MFGPFWELRQQHLIQDAHSEANLASHTADRAHLRLEDLADRFDRMALICMGMWSLIQEKTNLTEDDLIQRVQELDLKDGVDDDKLAARNRQCPICRRPMSIEHHKCLYCGHAPAANTAFEKV